MKRTQYNNPQNIKFSESEIEDLRRLVHDPGYLVILKIMEVRCDLQTAEHLALKPGSEEVTGSHALTVAKWEFFSEVEAQIAFLLDEAKGDGTPAKDQHQAEIENTVGPYKNGDIR